MIKKYKFLRIIMSVVCVFALLNCNDEKYTSIENGLYIEEAAPSNKFNQQVETQLVDETDVLKTLTVRLARAVDQEIDVRLEIDRQLLDEYNKANNTAYQVLPEEYMSFAKSVTIPAGEISAPVVNLIIKPYDASNGETYAIPIRIIPSNSSVPLIGNADHILYLLTSPNKQKSVILKRGETITAFKTELPVDEWTVEYWIKVDNITGRSTENWEGEANKSLRSLMFYGNSQPISFNSGESMLMLRYWPAGANKIAPTLQCQMTGTYFDSSEFWRPDVWYHIAYTYDGKTVQLYKDGSPDRSGTVDKDFIFTEISLCKGFNSTMQVEFAQIRIWNKCLSQSALKEGMSRQIPVDSEGLIGYWMCNEGEGNVLKDCTSNANDIVINAQTPKWSEKSYNFAHPNN